MRSLISKTCLAGFLALGAAWAAAPSGIYSSDYLLRKDDKVMLVHGGEEKAITEEVKLANGLLVKTNGTLVLAGGQERPMKDGQKLTLDGFVVGSDGRFLELADHVMLKDGKLTLVKDGQSSAVGGTVSLGDGTTVNPDGTFQRPDGRRGRLLDGQILLLSGPSLPPTDHVMLEGGRVKLQKDGSFLSLDPLRTIVMGDGTRVKGDGSIVKMDGTQLQLREGERYITEGAAVNKAR